MSAVYKNYIDGKWTAPFSGKYYRTYNPSDPDDCVGEFPLSEPEDVEQAVKAAHKAFLSWQKVLPMERSVFVEKFASLLEENVSSLGESLCREQGYR